MYSFIALVQQACIHLHVHYVIMMSWVKTVLFGFSVFYHLQVVIHVIRPGVHRIIYM